MQSHLSFMVTLSSSVSGSLGSFCPSSWPAFTISASHCVADSVPLAKSTSSAPSLASSVVFARPPSGVDDMCADEGLSAPMVDVGIGLGSSLPVAFRRFLVLMQEECFIYTTTY